MKDILERLTMAQVSSCTCLTKTPDTSYHDENCRYRVLEDAKKEIADLRKKYSDAMWTIYPDRMGG